METMDKKDWPDEVKINIKEQAESLDALDEAEPAEKGEAMRVELAPAFLTDLPLARIADLVVFPPALELCNLAQEVLQRLGVRIEGPTVLGSIEWDKDEDATFAITISNPTCCILRNMYCHVRAYGDAEIPPTVVLNGQEYWPELKPGRSIMFTVLVHATDQGSARLRVFLAAEVIPHGRTERTSGVYAIGLD